MLPSRPETGGREALLFDAIALPEDSGQEMLSELRQTNELLSRKA